MPKASQMPDYQVRDKYFPIPILIYLKEQKEDNT